MLGPPAAQAEGSAANAYYPDIGIDKIAAEKHVLLSLAAARRQHFEENGIKNSLSILVLAVAGLILSPGSAYAARTVLPITPIPQKTSEWCWAASATMVLQYFSMPALNTQDYQCGVVAFAFSGNPVCYAHCYSCPIPAGQFDNLTLILRRYGYFARSFLRLQSPDLHGRFDDRALTWAEAADSIDKNSPIVAGISANGFSNPYYEPQHVVVIVGYDDTTNTLIVNDPWPIYTLPTDPYIARGATLLTQGQYEIAYASFVSMLWNRSIHHMYTQ